MQTVLKPLLERPDADEEVYQLGGMLNKATGDAKECEKVYKKGLKVMDLTAFTLCNENKISIIVFDMNKSGNLLRVLEGESVGTLVEF